VVAMPDHPGNTRTDNGRARTLANLEDRPKHIRRVIDWASTESPYAPYLRPDTVAVIGHSMGGYTALALAGGRPTAFAAETPDFQARAVDVAPDDRVTAIVLLAPATAWFKAEGALDRVRVPVLLITAEHDEHTPPFHAEIVTRGVATVEHHIVANAGHFSFLDPFPPALTRPDFAPSQDPPGFDREVYHETLNAGVLAFLQRVR
jgi:predicted dienelactone hydrolase